MNCDKLVFDILICHIITNDSSRIYQYNAFRKENFSVGNGKKFFEKVS
jgi:hypothetical protein